MDLIFAFEIRRIIVLQKHQAKSTTNARLNKAASMLAARRVAQRTLPSKPPRAAALLAAARVAPRPRATTTIQQLTAGVGPLPTLVSNRAARVAPPRPLAATTLLVSNLAARVAP